MNEGRNVSNEPKDKEINVDTLHSTDDIGVDRLYVWRKEGGIRHASNEDCVDATFQGPEENTKKKKKKGKKYQLHQPVTAISTQISCGQTRKQQTINLGNKNNKKSNNIDIQSSKQQYRYSKLRRLDTRWSGYN